MQDSKYSKHLNDIFKFVWEEDNSWPKAAQKFQTSQYRLKQRLLTALIKNELIRR